MMLSINNTGSLLSSGLMRKTKHCSCKTPFRLLQIVASPLLCLSLITSGKAQQVEVLSLQDIIQKIDHSNILLKTFDLKAEGYQHSAEAATAWMPPMAGIGTFMMPYPFQRKMNDGDNGSLMLRVEQEIPSRKKLSAKKNYILSQGKIEKTSRAVTLNELKAQAKTQYFNWMIALQQIKVLEQNQTLLETIKKIEEVRYPYNQSQLSTVYRAEAEIEKNNNQLLMPLGEIAKAKAWLNALMNRSGNTDFRIDTTFELQSSASLSFDTAALAARRKDVLRLNESIQSMQLGIEATKLERKPAFRLQFDHMSPLSSMMPQAFSVMGMITIPIAPWSKKMYQSEVKSMQSNIKAMEQERAAMLQEAQGMLFGMQAEIETMKRRIHSMETKVIPALRKTFDASFISYQENRLSLTQVLDNWEAMNMMYLEVLEEKQRLFQLIVNYEKELFQ